MQMPWEISEKETRKGAKARVLATDLAFKAPGEIPGSSHVKGAKPMPMISLNEERITPMSPRRAAGFIFNHNGICYYCLEPVESTTPANPRHPTRDHKTPKARGGNNKRENLVLCCIGCNNVKSDMTDIEFQHFMATGKLSKTYIDWLAKRFLVAAERLGVPIKRGAVKRY